MNPETRTDAPAPATDGGRHWWLLHCLLPGLLAALPMLFSSHPPMVDLPQYAAQMSMLDNMLKGGWRFEHLFFINAFIPYLSGFALIGLLSKFCGLVLATKLAVMLSLAGLPMSTALLLREFRSNPFWAWLVLPASYGFGFSWGFLNFIAAAPLGLVLVLLVSRFTRAPGIKSGIVVALFTHLLFFSHVLVLFLAGAIGGLLVLKRAPSLREKILQLLPLLSVAPVGLAWGLPSLGISQANWPVLWQLGWHRLTDLPQLVLGMKAVSMWPLLIMLFALPMLSGGRPSRDWERYIPLALCLLILFLAPNLLAGNFFTYHRFAIFLIPAYLLILEPAPVEARIARLAKAGIVLTAVAWVGLLSLRSHAFERESRDFEPILAQMEPDKRVLSLILARESIFGAAPVYLHYPTWYQAEKGGVVDFNFAAFAGELVRYQPEKAPPFDNNMVWAPEMFDWAQHRGADYDYIIARVDPQEKRSVLNLANCQISLVAHSGAWWLYQVDARAVQKPVCDRPQPRS